MSDAYFREKAACCMSKDRIDRNLFDEFGVKEDFVILTEKAFLQDLPIFP